MKRVLNFLACHGKPPRVPGVAKPCITGLSDVFFADYKF